MDTAELVRSILAGMATDAHPFEELWEAWQNGTNVIVIRQDPDQPYGTGFVEFVPYVEDTTKGDRDER